MAERVCDSCGQIWNCTMGDTGCVNPHCPEKLLPRIAAQEHELAALRRVRNAAKNFWELGLDDCDCQINQDDSVVVCNPCHARNALKAALESEAGNE